MKTIKCYRYVNTKLTTFRITLRYFKRGNWSGWESYTVTPFPLSAIKLEYNKYMPSSQALIKMEPHGLSIGRKIKRARVF